MSIEKYNFNFDYETDRTKLIPGDWILLGTKLELIIAVIPNTNTIYALQKHDIVDYVIEPPMTQYFVVSYNIISRLLVLTEK